jgi:uncharacterized membrane protein YccC
MLLLETVIGSFLVWLFLDEVPPVLSLIGGIIVFSALACHGWLEVRRYRIAMRSDGLNAQKTNPVPRK